MMSSQRSVFTEKYQTEFRNPNFSLLFLLFFSLSTTRGQMYIDISSSPSNPRKLSKYPQLQSIQTLIACGFGYL